MSKNLINLLHNNEQKQNEIFNKRKELLNKYNLQTLENKYLFDMYKNNNINYEQFSEIQTYMTKTEYELVNLRQEKSKITLDLQKFHPLYCNYPKKNILSKYGKPY